MSRINYDHDDGPLSCPVCGSDLQWDDCWMCHGSGGFHNCNEDCCACLDKEEITELCEECKGAGGYLQCAALPHTEEQVAEYQSRAATP